MKSLRIRSRGINFIACPTCSRQEFDVIGTVNALEKPPKISSLRWTFRLSAAW
ncbi:flavodoxin-dependent (E)-4-hydroxy-3-methylbut-2-enyl-diphosphate synthase [Escherichia coli]